MTAHHRTRAPLPVTITVIVVCAVIWVAQLISEPVTDALFLSAETGASQPWRFLTAMFVHDPSLPTGVLHIGFNLLAMYFLGRILEPFWGWRRFLGLHLWSGLAGGVAFVALMPNPGDVDRWGGSWQLATVGASGAIFGHLGSIMLVQRAHRGPLGQIVAILVINLVITFQVPGIAWQAHIGGLVMGGLLTWLLLRHRRRALLSPSPGSSMSVGEFLIWALTLAAMIAVVVVRYWVAT